MMKASAGHPSIAPFVCLLIMVCSLAAIAPSAHAQTYRDVADAPAGTITLPHGLTPEEMLILDEIGITHRDTPPPTSQPVRHVAEFETMQGVMIAYPLGISTSIVRELAEDTIVYCVVTSGQQGSAQTTFANAGVNMDHVVFFNQATDSYWTRDYGPWYIFDNDLAPSIVDVIYNRPRPNDDEIPSEFASFLGIDAYGPDLIHTGGNWMTDGHGIAASTELVWDENPGHSHAEINQMVDEYLGIHTYHVVPDPNNTYIDHIDCWGKFLAVDKVLIRSVAPSHPQYDEIEATADYFANQISSYGWPFEVYRVYTPNNEPYTNSLIINKKVLVPITGSSWDDEALDSYEAAMPGYEVLGFTGSWESTDALHCRTKGVADLEMLYVWSRPLLNTASTTEPYRVAAEIIDHSEQGLITNQLGVYWRDGGSGPFHAEVMNAIAGTDSFYADIPTQPMGTTIQYYVHAEAYSGRIEDFPIVGPDGPFEFVIEEDLAPPVISGTTELHSTDDTNGPYPVETNVTDNMGIGQVTLLYRINGGAFAEVDMTPSRGVYSGEIPGQSHGSFVEYYVRAIDQSSNEATDPTEAPLTCFEFYIAPVVHYLDADMEGGSDWTHEAVTGGFGDQWHLSTTRNHTSGGTTSWKCGDSGAGDYAGLLDAGLVTETCPLGLDSELAYWQWIEAETSSYYTGYAYDGGLVEINTGSGWEMMTPEGGYPYLIRNTGGIGPFNPETGVFSGSQGWHEVTFNLSAYEGEAQFRFRFGSDDNSGAEGWYIDDIRVDGFEISGQSVTPPGQTELSRLQLAAPNPARPGARVTFQVPSTNRVRLRLFDAQGRVLAYLMDRVASPGSYQVSLPPVGDGNGPMGGGVYFMRLEVGSESEIHRFVLFR